MKLDVDALIAALDLPLGWTIEARVERSFKDRNRYTLAALWRGSIKRTWTHIYDVERALPVAVDWIEREATAPLYATWDGVEIPVR
jgi:hypothetical protein